jgi:hypothetical protein
MPNPDIKATMMDINDFDIMEASRPPRQQCYRVFTTSTEHWEIFYRSSGENREKKK